LKKVYLMESESKVAPILNNIVKRYRDVKIGSYPVIDNEEYSVMVTMESLDDVSLSAALKSLVDTITADKLVRVE